jgi:hypothetical protein
VVVVRVVACRELENTPVVAERAPAEVDVENTAVPAAMLEPEIAPTVAKFPLWLR